MSYYYYTFSSNTTTEIPPLSKVGGKARSLLQTAASNFAVPPGLVLTVDFFQPWLELVTKSNAWQNLQQEAPTLDHCNALKSWCQTNLTLEPQQQAQLDQALADTFGEESFRTVLAVRSSSPEEDLDSSSFAGGYDTILGVTYDNLQQALKTCFASLWDYRVIKYKQQQQHTLSIDEAQMAVIVQTQLASDMSGVAFSINPTNNAYDQLFGSCHDDKRSNTPQLSKFI